MVLLTLGPIVVALGGCALLVAYLNRFRSAPTPTDDVAAGVLVEEDVDW